jgi:hypothetical protein
MNRLLIISCSQRKKSDAGLLPAIDRYDGPAFRVLRKFLGEAPADPPVVLILSAKYGLIEAAQPLPDYDCRMSAALAKQLHPLVLEAGMRILGSDHWQEVGFCVGKQYRAALDGLREFVPGGARVGFIGGGLGRRLTALRGWLRRAERVDGTVAPV